MKTFGPWIAAASLLVVPLFARAQLRVGLLYRDRLGDAPSARRAFRRIVDDYPTSVLRDDALVEEARTRRASGDAPGACRSFAELVHHFPESRYRREADTALGGACER